MAYYLKYRPQTLNDLVGQESVKKAISAAFGENRLSHAYLFVGPRGTGKTSTARILAKMVNCEAKGEVPCNKCTTCVSITDGSNLDLIEIDAASNRGIEDIRALREKIKLSPTAASKKVYIIDEAHMLTTEAFNALLKTLEEPPAHALFILATTDAQKIPQTIASRTQRLDFKLASTKELLEALQKIVRPEKIDIDEEALQLLAKASDGSFRDAVKLLDQVSSMSGKITVKVLEDLLKTSKFDEVLDLIKSLGSRDIASSLLNISKRIEEGLDIKELILSLMDVLRSLVFIKSGLGEQLVEVNLTEDKYGQLLKLSDNLSSQDLVRSLNILQKALENLKTASILSLPLELAVVEICGSETQTHLRGEPEVSPNVHLGGVPSKEVVVEEKETVVISETPMPSDVSDSPDILKLKEKWTFVLETIRPVNYSLEALLRSINVTECTDTTVIMEVPYSFHQRILEAPKNRDLLESIFSDILGRSIRVSTVLGSRPERKEDIANIEVAADDEIIRAAAEIFNSDTIN